MPEQPAVTSPPVSQPAYIPPTPVTQPTQTVASPPAQPYSPPQTAVAPSDFAKQPETIRQLSESLPYTLMIREATRIADLSEQLKKLRRNGLDAFVIIDFSDPANKKYNLCYGSFASPAEATKKSRELQFLGFSGAFQPRQIPVTVLIGSYDTRRSAEQALTQLSDLSEFLYLQASNRKPDAAKRYYLLFSGFPDIESAELVRASWPELSQKSIVKR